MNLRILRVFDRFLGPAMLMALAPLARLAEAFMPDQPASTQKRHVFLKLKGGGSLLIAMPALLALRRQNPTAVLTLVCTAATKAYAELIGVFDAYSVINDRTPWQILKSGFEALRQCRGAELCVDLEPNSNLAALFTVLTLARQRIGLVKTVTAYRAAAYTDAISYNPYAPIYIYYDQIAAMLKATPVAVAECRQHMLARLKQSPKPSGETIGIAAFTSDLAHERMMPAETWAALLTKERISGQAKFAIFGSEKDRPAGEAFAARLKAAMPASDVVNLCGKYTLAETAGEILKLDAFWAVDSGLLHLARLLGIKCKSFWGPTMPSQLLRPIPGLAEEVVYRPFACSPCVHHTLHTPCRGNNLCMKTMADPAPDLAPIWKAKG